MTVFDYRTATRIAVGQVAGVCSLLYARLTRLIAFHSPDKRISAAARAELESDISLNSQYSSKEISELLSSLNR